MEFSFIDRGASKRAEPEIIRSIQEILSRGGIRVEGELEKTESQREEIALINEFIQGIFNKLRLSYTPISEQRIHLLPSRMYESLFPGRSGEVGCSRSEYGDVIINAEWQSFSNPHLTPVFLFANKLHESIHYQAAQKLVVDDAADTVSSYRSGYRLSSSGEDKFVGLNEGVVSLLEGELIEAHGQELADRFGLTVDEVENVAYTSYPEYIELVEHLIDLISEARNETRGEAYRRVVGEQFTGNMQHLRTIEQIYGKGSLRLLAELGGNSTDKNARILAFFMCDDTEERARILSQINSKA